MQGFKALHSYRVVGISIYPRDGADVDTLIRKVDEAMYAAKNSGKNAYHSASSHC
ncbi:diguanylate cyclase [Parahaliea sp. F7430]|uniref:Diguanylate cyclase n=1 Tax=Sediminihaliea albiluteola TaxID=2758564 RepID=A0A7W2TU60_9GAMM|nr:diguanylate cyclase [Sediminihaliea albiluteola]